MNLQTYRALSIYGLSSSPEVAAISCLFISFFEYFRNYEGLSNLRTFLASITDHQHDPQKYCNGKSVLHRPFILMDNFFFCVTFQRINPNHESCCNNFSSPEWSTLFTILKTVKLCHFNVNCKFSELLLYKIKKQLLVYS